MIYKSFFLLTACILMTGCFFQNSSRSQDDTVTRFANEDKVYTPELGARFKRTIYTDPKGQIKWNTISGIEFFHPSHPNGKTVKYYPEDQSTAESSASFYYDKINSPDKKWIVLPVGRRDGFAFSPTKDTMTALEQGKFQGRFSARTTNGTPLFHEFVRWEAPAIFVFAASGNDGGTEIDELYRVNLNTGNVTLSPKAKTTTQVSLEKNQ